MDAREQRGLVIAALCKLNRQGDQWLVPSQSAERRYTVDPAQKTCTCPDHQEGGYKCKHIYAVEFVAKREVMEDGAVVETRTLTFTEEKRYTQNWPAYNEAQAHEKERFLALLHDLCSGIVEPDRGSKPGRKPHAIKDAVFAAVAKVYSTFSSRRFATDLRDAHAKGYTATPIPGAKVPQFFENEDLTPILKALIARSARPLRAVETQFAIDSTGFGSNRFEKWFDHKYNVTRQQCVWVKAHVAVGVKTNIVTAVRILDKDAADGPQLKPLLDETAESFRVDQVSGDKAYCTVENYQAIADHGGMGFLAFKSNATGAAGGIYEKMFRLFMYRQEEFMQHYHRRSNVESTFSAIKRKFGDAVRSKTDVAMVNEVLCKLLAWNICVVIQEQCELNIEAEFWKDAPKSSAPILAVAQ